MTLQEKLQNIMQQAVDNCEVAGVNLLVEQDGQEVCYCQAGMADREGNRPMSRDTIFRLYSQSKPITAAAAMILMERGELDLCQPVSDFLPAFAEQFYVANENSIGDAAAGGKRGTGRRAGGDERRAWYSRHGSRTKEACPAAHAGIRSSAYDFRACLSG